MDSLRTSIVTGSRILDHEGCVGSVGHLSLRLPDRPDHFLITPRKGPALSSEADLLVVDTDGRVVSGESEPNSEVFIHCGVYRARPDVGAVAHTHSPSAIVLGIVGEPVRVVHNWGVSFHDGVPVYEELGYVRNARQGADLAARLGDHRGCLMKGHGAVVVGADVVEAVVRSLELEYNASLQVAAVNTGRPYAVYPPEVARALDGQGNPARLWDYFRHRAGLD